MKEKLLKIQQEIGAIKKDSKADVGNFSYDYFDINTLLAEIKPILQKHKVLLLQGLTNVNGKIAIETRLVSTDEEADDYDVSFTAPLPDCPDAQKYGSAITYFRRYSLVSLFALESLDDDGASASVQSAPKQALKAPISPATASKPKINPTTQKPVINDVGLDF